MNNAVCTLCWHVKYCVNAKRTHLRGKMYFEVSVNVANVPFSVNPGYLKEITGGTFLTTKLTVYQALHYSNACFNLEVMRWVSIRVMFYCLIMCSLHLWLIDCLKRPWLDVNCWQCVNCSSSTAFVRHIMSGWGPVRAFGIQWDGTSRLPCILVVKKSTPIRPY